MRKGIAVADRCWCQNVIVSVCESGNNKQTDADVGLRTFDSKLVYEGIMLPSATIWRLFRGYALTSNDGLLQKCIQPEYVFVEMQCLSSSSAFSQNNFKSINYDFPYFVFLCKCHHGGKACTTKSIQPIALKMCMGITGYIFCDMITAFMDMLRIQIAGDAILLDLILCQISLFSS